MQVSSHLNLISLSPKDVRCAGVFWCFAAWPQKGRSGVFLLCGGRPTCAKTSCAPAFVCVRGAPVAHEVLFLFNTHCIRLCPAAEKLQISCRAGRVCPLLCPPVKAQSDEKPVSHRPVFSVSPPFPPGFFLHLFDIIHPSQRLYRELFTLSTGFSTPSPP